VHVLCSHISALEFLTEPPISCPNSDSRDVAFVKATSAIGGCDVVEEDLACGLYSLSAGASFERIIDGVTPILRVKLPLAKFHAVRSDDEDDVQFLARVELEAESVVGGYSRPEQDACVASLPNGGCLNQVFELAGVAYGPRPEPGTEAHVEASKKRKTNAYSKTGNKRAKVPAEKKTRPLKIIVSKTKSGVKRPSDAEIASAKPIK
jgi:hypothetical protein